MMSIFGIGITPESYNNYFYNFGFLSLKTLFLVFFFLLAVLLVKNRNQILKKFLKFKIVIMLILVIIALNLTFVILFSNFTTAHPYQHGLETLISTYSGGAGLPHHGMTLPVLFEFFGKYFNLPFYNLLAINLVIFYLSSIALFIFLHMHFKNIKLSLFSVFLYLFNPILIKFSTSEINAYSYILFLLLSLIFTSLYFTSKEKNNSRTHSKTLKEKIGIKIINTIFKLLAIISLVFSFNSGTFGFTSVFVILLYLIIMYPDMIMPELKKYHNYILLLIFIILIFTDIVSLLLFKLEHLGSGGIIFREIVNPPNYFFDFNMNNPIYVILILGGIINFLLNFKDRRLIFIVTSFVVVISTVFTFGWFVTKYQFVFEQIWGNFWLIIFSATSILLAEKFISSKKYFTIAVVAVLSLFIAVLFINNLDFIKYKTYNTRENEFIIDSLSKMEDVTIIVDIRGAANIMKALTTNNEQTLGKYYYMLQKNNITIYDFTNYFDIINPVNTDTDRINYVKNITLEHFDIILAESVHTKILFYSGISCYDYIFNPNPTNYIIICNLSKKYFGTPFSETTMYPEKNKFEYVDNLNFAGFQTSLSYNVRQPVIGFYELAENRK